ncbi:MAG: hypothetical protein IPJ27_10745 [Candidatus Accumulibacter sp.]|uniref:Uncharacterized protein n=1 Tax=Candidatus Accumulibacter proximus TaxID=2954385 RepID=A0A935PXJ7_9PROT|nr:hypothetical protein [Candidatus Accumulibacter proximus]
MSTTSTGEVLAVDRQGDGVACPGVATDRAGDIASDFGGVEDVVGGMFASRVIVAAAARVSTL